MDWSDDSSALRCCHHRHRVRKRRRDVGGDPLAHEWARHVDQPRLRMSALLERAHHLDGPRLRGTRWLSKTNVSPGRRRSSRGCDGRRRRSASMLWGLLGRRLPLGARGFVGASLFHICRGRVAGIAPIDDDDSRRRLANSIGLCRSSRHRRPRLAGDRPWQRLGQRTWAMSSPADA